MVAVTVLVVEVAIAVGRGADMGASRGAASRLYLATTARPTLLLVVALLSYMNVVSGRSISLGRADWIVWVPALVLYAVGAGLAALPQPASRSVWIGLAAWLSAVTLVGESRLLLITLKGPADMHRTRAQSRLVSAASSSLSCECAASPSASKRSLASPSSRVKSPSRQATSRTARSRLSDTTSQACQPRSSTRSVAPPRLSTSPRLRKPRSGAHRRLRREPRRRSSTLTMRATFARRRPARLTSSSTARAPRRPRRTSRAATCHSSGHASPTMKTSAR